MAQEENVKAIKCIQYKELQGWEKEWVKKCCLKPEDEQPGGCDCCYDEWTREYKRVLLDLNLKVEEAAQAEVQYQFLNDKRDTLKLWYENLTKADETVRTICGHLDALEAQVAEAHANSTYAIAAVNYLFCMIKGFYLELDDLRIKLDDLLTCIQKLNHPEVNKSGVYKALQVYNEKLDALIKTRDELIRLIILAIRLADRVEEELSENFGLQMVLACWRENLKCKSTDEKPDPGVETELEKKCEEPPRDCKFELPAVTFPITGSVYFKKIKKLYTCHNELSNSWQTKLTVIRKKKDELATLAVNLKKAMDETNPEQRCK